MQDETLDLFIKDIKSIRDYLQHIKLIDSIGAVSQSSTNNELIQYREHLHGFRVSKKIFEYKSLIISLYGILEKHLGEWIVEFINKIPEIVSNYNNLPQRFRDNHFNLSAKLLTLVSEGKLSKYENMKRESILANLNSCIETPTDFRLNGEAFYMHSGNLKHAKVVEALNYLDIRLTPKLKTIGQRPGGFLCNNSTATLNPSENFFNLVDDIVSRRNDIAHGQIIDNILNIAELHNYVDYLEGYGHAVFETLIDKLYELETEHLCKEITNIKGVFKNGSVLCFEIENNQVCLGDDIIVKQLDGTFVKKEILEIQKDNGTFEYLSIKGSEYIGVNLGSGISKGQNFFIFNK